MLAVIGLLGIIFSGSVIYFLALRRIRLARCQSYFIMNVAVSDVLVSLLGVFRGLGIINSRFVGAPNNTTTPFCAIYKIFLTTFACSGISVLLPLTIDRAVAITLPLRHSSIITKKTCVVMFLANWLPNLALMLYEVIAWLTGTIQIEYNDRYYRCLMVTGLIVGNIEKFCFVIIPFLVSPCPDLVCHHHGHYLQKENTHRTVPDNRIRYNNNGSANILSNGGHCNVGHTAQLRGVTDTDCNSVLHQWYC